jgi:dienelactone hydrolase
MRRHIKWTAVVVVLLHLGLRTSASVAQDQTRQQFLAMIDRPRVALAARVEQHPSTNPADAAVIHFSYASDAQHRVPGIQLFPPKAPQGRMPVVIVLHGTGGTKESELPLMRELASAGFLAVAIDGPHHGERTQAKKGAAEYNQAILRTWQENGGNGPTTSPALHEHPFYYDTVWDVMRLVDHLEEDPAADPARIGLIGISKGGIETYLTAAVDPRIAVAVPCIGVQSFRWALDNNDWKGRIGTIQTAFDDAAKAAGVEHPDSKFVQAFYDGVVPGIADRFDGPVMLPLIAPRPLMVINGDSDNHTPLPGVKLATDAAAAAYRAAGAEDHLVVRIEEKTAHKVTAESQHAAVEWFVRWLKPAR